jgi:nicotinamide phosphoribosyltransferase
MIYIDKMKVENGKVVIRPDSGDPVDIICGYRYRNIPEWNIYWLDIAISQGYTYVKLPDGIVYSITGKDTVVNQNAAKGIIELLWETFGGTLTEKGFKILDSHIGAIYGDAITLDRCNQICKRLADKGFASTNMVFGIGSFTYQYNTRDTFGHALKSTHVVIDGIESNIFKDPITDNGVKKSQTGKVAVIIEDGKIVFKDGLTTAQEGWYSGSGKNLLKTIFCNGVAYNLTTLQEIRDRISK